MAAPAPTAKVSLRKIVELRESASLAVICAKYTPALSGGISGISKEFLRVQNFDREITLRTPLRPIAAALFIAKMRMNLKHLRRIRWCFIDLIAVLKSASSKRHDYSLIRGLKGLLIISFG